jgi:hypothetical protein
MEKDYKIFLDGVKKEYKKELISLLQQIDWTSIQNKIVKETIIYIIRHIYLLLKENSDSQFSHLTVMYKNHNNNKLINMISVKEIISQLNEYIQFIEYSKKYLFNLDNQAELLKLFCENYAMGLSKKLNVL